MLKKQLYNARKLARKAQKQTADGGASEIDRLYCQSKGEVKLLLAYRSLDIAQRKLAIAAVKELAGNKSPRKVPSESE